MRAIYSPLGQGQQAAWGDLFSLTVCRLPRIRGRPKVLIYFVALGAGLWCGVNSLAQAPPPLGEEKVLALLHVGISPHRVAILIEQRGIDFDLTQQVESDLRHARSDSEYAGQVADSWTKAAGTERNPDARAADQAKALEYYQKILQLDPNNAPIHNNLGKLYADTGRSAEAQEEFQKAAELDPSHAANYYYNLGAIMINKGRMDEAATALKKATDLDPTHANAWYWYGMALMDKATIQPDATVIPAPGTIEAFQTYLKLAPNGPFAAQAQSSLDTLQGKTRSR